MAAPVRPRLRPVAAVAGGVLLAAVLVGAIAWSGLAPEVLVPAGTIETVPAFLNGTAQEGGPAECQQHDDCGHAGVLEIAFDLSGPAALSGTLNVPYSLTLALTNPIGLSNLAEGWWSPAGNGTTQVGGETYEAAAVSGNIDLGTLEFGFDGPTNVVPAGSWTLCLVNWGTEPVLLTVTSSVVESPR